MRGDLDHHLQSTGVPEEDPGRRLVRRLAARQDVGQETVRLAKESMTDLVSYISICWGDDPKVMDDIEAFKEYNGFMQNRFISDMDYEECKHNIQVALLRSKFRTVSPSIEALAASRGDGGGRQES